MKCETCGKKVTRPEIGAAVFHGETNTEQVWCDLCWNNPDEEALHQYQNSQGTPIRVLTDVEWFETVLTDHPLFGEWTIVEHDAHEKKRESKRTTKMVVDGAGIKKMRNA